MEHIVKFEGGYDCVRFECKHGSQSCIPKSGGSHGIHGLSIRFVVKGEEGAVQFLLYTGWLPQFTSPSSIGSRDISDWGAANYMPMPADLGYHSKTPRHEGQGQMAACEYCDGLPCYYDGSGLNASDAMYALVNGGDDALWLFLDAYYASVFANGKYPSPAEYPMQVRSK